jgi:serine/threonine protein kinase
MAACLHADTHPNLVPVLGVVAAHPQGKSALVMALIDPAFINLAGPPSLDSCTRDVYSEDTAFELATALSLALGIARAARHLHARGLMHGDLYGHNILHNRVGAGFLGDFGAASFLPLQDPPQALALQRLEVRAFGCLLEELLAHSPSHPDSATHQALTQLKTACLNEAPTQRPLFSAIEQALKDLT